MHAGNTLQGYLTHKKPPPHLGPPQGPKHRPYVGSWEGTVFYKRGTPVGVVAASHDAHGSGAMYSKVLYKCCTWLPTAVLVVMTSSHLQYVHFVSSDKVLLLAGNQRARPKHCGERARCKQRIKSTHSKHSTWAPRSLETAPPPRAMLGP
jgi:hypothetical protein